MLVYWMISYCCCFLSGFKCAFSCMVQYSLYHNINKGTTWHCTLVSSTPPQSIGVIFGCALFWCWVSLGAPVTISLIEFYFIMIFIMIALTIIGIFLATNYSLNCTLDFLYLSSSGSAYAQLPGCFRSWTLPWILDGTCYLLYVMFAFPTRIYYRGVPGLATDCPYSVWCRGLTTYLLYVGPLFFFKSSLKW